MSRPLPETVKLTPPLQKSTEYTQNYSSSSKQATKGFEENIYLT
jgi:hypothetical protein